MTLDFEGYLMTFETLMSYEYKRDESLKVKYVYEDGKIPLITQCYPESNRLRLEVTSFG